VCTEPAGGSERRELAGDSPRGARPDLIPYRTPLSAVPRRIRHHRPSPVSLELRRESHC